MNKTHESIERLRQKAAIEDESLVSVGGLVSQIKEMPPERGTMSVLNVQGDLTVTWNPNVPAEVEAAREQFTKMTKEKKYAAFKLNAQGDKGEQIREFEPLAKRILLCPPVVGG